MISAITHDSRRVIPGIGVPAAWSAPPPMATCSPPVPSRPGRWRLLVEHLLPSVSAADRRASTSAAMGHIAAAVHGHPTSRLTMVGVTGTNGKTTAAHLLAAILGGDRVRHRRDDRNAVRRPHHARGTRPAGRLAGYVAGGRDAVVMEVSPRTRAGPAPGDRHPVRRRRVHQPRSRPPRSARVDGGVLPPRRPRCSCPPERHGVTNLDDPYGRLLLDIGHHPTWSPGLRADEATEVKVGASDLALPLAWSTLRRAARRPLQRR